MLIGVVNNKGGVLKTTLSTNLAACLSLDKKKTIIVDLDGQGNVVATFGKSPFNLKYSVMDFLKGQCTLDQVIIRQMPPYLDIMPGNDDLNFFDIYARSGEVSQSSLKLMLNKLNQIYDYVIVDTPPNMSSVVATVLSIANVAIIPFEPDQYAILGLRRIVNASKEFKNKINPNMKVIAVPTKVNSRVTIHRDIINENIRPKLTKEEVYVTRSYISQSTKSTSAVGYEHVPIIFSIIKSKYQDEYIQLKNEIIDFIKEGWSVMEKYANLVLQNSSANKKKEQKENIKTEQDNNLFNNEQKNIEVKNEPVTNTNINSQTNSNHITTNQLDNKEPILTFNYSDENNNGENK